MATMKLDDGAYVIRHFVRCLLITLSLLGDPGVAAIPAGLVDLEKMTVGTSDALPRSEVQRVLDGYNYVLKSSANEMVESIIVSGVNGSGAGRQPNDSSAVDSGPQLALADASAQPPIQLRENAHGQQAIDALGEQLAVVAIAHGMTVERFKEILLSDATAWIDMSGRLYYVETPRPGGTPENATTTSTGQFAAAGPAVFDLSKTFLLHSRQGSSRVIYLDFNGHSVTGSGWNTSFGKPTIEAPAFDIGGNPAVFDDNELARIQNIWSRVSEDYAPFDIDVTTEEPSMAALERSSMTDLAYGTRAVITTNILNCTCGGIAYVGVFDFPGIYYKPAWVFYDKLGMGNEKYVAEAVSHEVGHNFGLNHDGTASVSYYQGHGMGTTGWAPIMGVGYYKELVQWSKGEYSGANNKEDDFNIIQGHGAAIRPDDAGDSIAMASPLGGTGNAGGFSIDQSGIIERQSDVDYYVFATSGGAATLDIAPAVLAPNLDISASLYLSNGTLFAASNPTSTLGATISADLPAGTYFLKVDGAGITASVSDSGFSDYGSLGQYRITGQYAQGLAQAPVAVATASPTSGTAPLPVSFSSGGSRDDGVIVTYNWNFGDGTSASTEPNPLHSFSDEGTHPVFLTVTDNAGLTSRAALSITVLPVQTTSTLRASKMAIKLTRTPTRTRAKVLVRVTNANGQSVPKATISGKWSSLVAGNASAVTNASGVATVLSPLISKKKGTFTFTISGISRRGYTYQPAKNVLNSISITR